jgi:hypothetical protein
VSRSPSLAVGFGTALGRGAGGGGGGAKDVRDCLPEPILIRTQADDQNATAFLWLLHPGAEGPVQILNVWSGRSARNPVVDHLPQVGV